MALWHDELPNKYGSIEKFNHGFPVSLGVKSGIKTLEIGAGIGAHAEYEDLSIQDYSFFEYRKEFCEKLKTKFPSHEVVCGDIQTKQKWQDGSFDRIIAIHVLEHLPDLPKALEEINRLLKADGVFDIVIPCEGGLAHSLGRKFTAERIFKKHFKMDFAPICKNEHVSTYLEIMHEVKRYFMVEKQKFFPALVPVHSLNFVAGFRLGKL